MIPLLLGSFLLIMVQIGMLLLLLHFLLHLILKQMQPLLLIRLVTIMRKQLVGYNICIKIGSAGDESGVMSMQLFNPSSTTYVKHFLIEGQQYDGGDASVHNFVGGYANTTTAINAMHIKAASGSIANGVFKIWGVK